MDREIESAQIPTEAGQVSPYASGHLMCRSALWGIAGFLGCAYFAWVSFAHVAKNELEWPHDAWTSATYIVWVLLLLALAYDTRCMRERLFFSVLMANFLAGGALTVWSNISLADMRNARIGTGALWAVAGLLSLSTLRRAPELTQRKQP
jgi:hypothetical protein